MKHDRRIAVEHCETYEPEAVYTALKKSVEKIDGLDWVTPGMRIAVKTNLVNVSAPEAACVTHPSVVIALTRLLTERGAQVVIGDSPGGLFTEGHLKRAYQMSGISEAEAHGASLNLDVSVEEVFYQEALRMKQFPFSSWIRNADAVIDCCKLKTHGMMAMTANVKNLFGTIPGAKKPECHFRFPRHEDFADMLVDLCCYVKPRLCVTDAIVGMEGNGPTAGRPKKIGALLVSRDPFALDVLCARLIGLLPKQVPTIAAAARRGLCGMEVREEEIRGEWKSLIHTDFALLPGLKDIEFSEKLPPFVQKIGRKVLMAVPRVKKMSCIGCGKCASICPAAAIAMVKGKPAIDRKRCIRCFCCQEFCPAGAMKVHRNRIAGVFEKTKR